VTCRKLINPDITGIELSDEQRIAIVNNFVEEHRDTYGKFPPPPVLEYCASFILKNHMARTEEYKIIPIRTLEGHQSRERQLYEDSYEYNVRVVWYTYGQNSCANNCFTSSNSTAIRIF